MTNVDKRAYKAPAGIFSHITCTFNAIKAIVKYNYFCYRNA